MKKRRFTEEQIITKLREAEIKVAQGLSVEELCRDLGISNQTYYRWRKRYGGMDVSHARRLKELERENSRLKKIVAEQALDNSILKEVASGNL